MKGLNDKIAWISLLAFSLSFFSACKDDDAKPVEVRIKQIRTYSGGTLRSTNNYHYDDGRLVRVSTSSSSGTGQNVFFEYDQQGRLSKVHNDKNDCSQTYSYSDDRVSFIATDMSESTSSVFDDSITIFLNDKGLPVRGVATSLGNPNHQKFYTYRYDDNGDLHQKSWTFNWEGNTRSEDSLVSEEFYYSAGVSNPLWGMFDQRYPFLRYSVLGTQNAAETMTKDLAADVELWWGSAKQVVSEYSIEEKNGYPIKAKAITTSGDNSKTSTTQYDYYGL